MTNTFQRTFTLASAALLVAAACGGSTSSGLGAGGTAGASAGGTAGASAGSTGASAGNAGESGSGSSGTGGSSASGGSSGAAGYPPEWFACSDTSECVVKRKACCEDCGPKSAGDAISVNRTFENELVAKKCGPTGLDQCGDVFCESAPTWILPFCLEGECTAIDIREDKLTSCGDAAQCRLRWGTACCEFCADIPEMLVAVNSQVDYDASVCGKNFGGCPPCAPPPFPANARAACNADHHCEVVRTK